MDTAYSFSFAFVGGFAPALIWLWFWLKEEETPEPRHLLIVAFMGGMVAVAAALYLEHFLLNWITKSSSQQTLSLENFQLYTGIVLIVGAAFIEELVKYLSVVLFIFWQKAYHEPVDAMIYLITAAMGFAASENVLYLQAPFANNIYDGLTVINLRFIGATLLHALSSALLGYFIAGAYFRGRLRKDVAIILGLISATLLHTLFNLTILVEGSKGTVGMEPSIVLLVVVGILVLFAFERIKHKIKKRYA